MKVGSETETGPTISNCQIAMPPDPKLPPPDPDPAREPYPIPIPSPMPDPDSPGPDVIDPGMPPEPLPA